jgi:hypothetical protein
MQSRLPATVWMAIAFVAALGLSGAVLVVLGPGARGTTVALQLTARFSFPLFFPAYIGGSLVTLFGPTFFFGLAFASAQSVHLILVIWLCLIGSAPATATFVFFGVAAFWMYLIAGVSIAGLQPWVWRKTWWVLRVIGLNFIAYAFAKDFLGNPASSSVKYLLGYLPFIVLAITGPLLRIAVYVKYSSQMFKGVPNDLAANTQKAVYSIGLAKLMSPNVNDS